MKKLPLLLLSFGLIGLGVLAFFGVQFLATHYLESQPAKAGEQVSCRAKGRIHDVRIRDNRMEPATVTAKACERLRITNMGETTRLVSFGKHERHIAYDGVRERELAHDQSLTITLNETGDYLFHDHYDEAVAARFSVR